ncbi:hypothetical protein LZ31DRAFT_314550 [Colletotrichum somersetense]|nr:hypothetical protein LZ31DRAFT_314550 [Colletotrichum somersetense]
MSLAPRKTPWLTLVYDARCTLNYSWARRVGRAKVRPSQLAAGAAPNSPTRRLPLLDRGHNDRAHRKAGHVQTCSLITLITCTRRRHGRVIYPFPRFTNRLGSSLFSARPWRFKHMSTVNENWWTRLYLFRSRPLAGA